MADERITAEMMIKVLGNGAGELQRIADGLKETDEQSTSVGQAFDTASASMDNMTVKARALASAEAQQQNATKALADAQRALAQNTDPSKQTQLEMAVVKAKEKLVEADKAVNNLAESDKKLGLSLTDLKSGIDMISAGFQKFMNAAEAALDFAKLGAQVKETQNSFERMREEHGLDINYLDQLRAALNGTATDMEIMSGATTVTAGTSKEFGDAILEAYPRLAEFAKAASKLNPNLGDTAYMLQSITTGLKRNSPLILDNLGITVKLGEAHEKYAETIGKSADQLSVEEQQMALLNGVMEAGNRLVEQAGGSVEALTDKYERLSVATENHKNIMAETWGAIIGELVDALGITDELIKSTNRYKFDDLRKEAEALGLEFDDIQWDWLAAMGGSAEEQAVVIDQLTKKLNSYKTTLSIVNAESRESTLAETEAAAADMRRAETAKESKEALDEYAKALQETALARGERLDTSWFEDSIYWAKARENAEKAVVQAAEDAAEAQRKAGEAAVAAAQQAAAAQGDEFAALLENKDGLDDLIKKHGQVIIVQSSSTAAHEKAALAMLEAEKAGRHLANVERELAENSDPTRVTDLEIAVYKAREAFRAANQEAGLLNATLTNGYTYTADLSDKIDKELAEAFYNAADAAGADAQQMAVVALAINGVDEATVQAALKTALINEKIKELATSYKDGKISIDEAKTALENFRTILENPYSVPMPKTETGKDGQIVFKPVIDESGLIKPGGLLEQLLGQDKTPAEMPIDNALVTSGGLLEELGIKADTSKTKIDAMAQPANLVVDDNLDEVKQKADDVLERLEKIKNGKWTATVTVNYKDSGLQYEQ